MKYILSGLMLFILLALTGVDVNATATDGANATKASEFVTHWTADTNKILSKGYFCNEGKQDEVYAQVYSFVQKASLESSLWRSDLASFEQAMALLKSVANEEIKQCKDTNNKWAYLLGISDKLVAYIHG